MEDETKPAELEDTDTLTYPVYMTVIQGEDQIGPFVVQQRVCAEETVTALERATERFWQSHSMTSCQIIFKDVWALKDPKTVKDVTHHERGIIHYGKTRGSYSGR